MNDETLDAVQGIYWVDWQIYGGALAKIKPNCMFCGARATQAACGKNPEEKLRVAAPACDDERCKRLAVEYALAILGRAPRGTN